MNKIIKYIIAGLVLFLLLLAFQNWRQSRRIEKQSEEIERLKNNQQQLLDDAKQSFTLLVKEKELTGKYLCERDSLAKALKIKPKQIIKYVDRIITEVTHDTVEVESEYLKDFIWHLSDGDKCWRWEADAQLDNLDLNINRTLFDYKNKSTEVFWFQRKKVLFLPIGKKLYYQNVIPECGDIITRSIEIKRK